MISIKTIIQTSFVPNQCPFYEKEPFKKKRLALFLGKSNKSNYNNNSDQDDDKSSSPKGDNQKQELLVRIAMIQTQKVRLTDYLDERSEYLTQFAEEASAEIDQVGENALRELDEAGNRIMENLESKMQAFEESEGFNKREIEENEKILAEFEDQIENDRNEGLFFKNLGKNKPVDKAKASVETILIKELTKKSAGSIFRRNIYLALIGLVGFGIIDASISTKSEWWKIGVLLVVFVGLVSQTIYEQSMLSEIKSKDDKK